MSALAVRLRGYGGRGLVTSARRQPLAAIGLFVAAAWIVVAIFAPLIAPANPLAQTLTPSQSPNWQWDYC